MPFGSVHAPPDQLSEAEPSRCSRAASLKRARLKGFNGWSMRTRAKSRRPRAFNSNFRHFSPGGRSPSSTQRVYRIHCGLTALSGALFAAAFVQLSAELSVSDAKQLGKRRRSFGCEIFIGAKVSFDNLRRRLFRIIDHGFCFFGLRIATAENPLHRNVEPRGESRDVVCIRFAGAVFDA